MKIFKNMKNGFTLAEVLITLGIIGVVADIIKVDKKYFLYDKANKHNYFVIEKEQTLILFALK